MQNVTMSVLGSELTIKVDLSKEFGPSASGKTIGIASTKGNVNIMTSASELADPVGLDLGNMVVGLNVYKKKD